MLIIVAIATLVSLDIYHLLDLQSVLLHCLIWLLYCCYLYLGKDRESGGRGRGGNRGGRGGRGGATGRGGSTTATRGNIILYYPTLNLIIFVNKI